MAFVLAVACVLGWARTALADELQDVSKLVAAGRLIEARNRADAFLEKTPKDAQMRFLKGVILSQQGERDDAVAVFTGITQDYPELPEPYNNLAVIHAAKGQYDDARVALETAIRVAPTDATAHENLGDIYAALAARSYRDARRYDSRNASALRKLDVVKGMLTTPPGAPPTAPIAAAASDTPVGSTTAVTTAATTPATATTASVANIDRSQSAVGLPGPARFPSVTAGALAESPEAILPAGTTGAATGVNVVGMETSAVEAPMPTATLAGAETRIAAAGDTTAIEQVTAAVRGWAAARSSTTSDLSIRVDGDAAVARFHAAGQVSRKAVDAHGDPQRTLTLRRDAGSWTVIDEGAVP